jgi:hypothetical protein
MADQKLSELASATTANLTGLLYVVQDGAGKKITVSDFVSSIARHVWVTVPTTSGSIGVQGTAAYDSSNIYVCVATNTWKRAGLSDW